MINTEGNVRSRVGYIMPLDNWRKIDLPLAQGPTQGRGSTAHSYFRVQKRELDKKKYKKEWTFEERKWERD